MDYEEKIKQIKYYINTVLDELVESYNKLQSRAKLAEVDRDRYLINWFESAERESQLSNAIDRAGLREQIEAAEKQTNN